MSMNKEFGMKINDLAIDKGFSGVISVRKDGNVVYESAFGYGDRANKRAINPETKFGIASGTKFFTALAIGKLIDEGLINMDTKVFDLLDYDFEYYSKDVTVRHLLTHTSGIPDYYDEDEIEDFSNFHLEIPWFKLSEPEDYFPIMPKRPMKAKVGEVFCYNNSGYIFLAAAVSKISKIPFSEYVNKEIFDKANMKDSGFYEFNDLPQNTALGYVEDTGNETNIYNLPIKGAGDGGAYSTLGDLYRLWDSLLSYEIVSEEIVTQYLSPYVKDSESSYYGHGLWVSMVNGDIIDYGMVGCDAGVSFRSAVSEDKSVVYTVISNTANGAWPIIHELKNNLFIR